MPPLGSSLGLRGPIPPMCTHIDADPGPPLKQNVSGRLCGIGAVQRVRHVEDVRFGFAGRILERHLRHRRRVVEHFAVDGDGMMRHHRRFVDLAADRGSGSGDASASAARGRCGRRRRLWRLRCRGGRRGLRPPALRASVRRCETKSAAKNSGMAVASR